MQNFYNFDISWFENIQINLGILVKCISPIILKYLGLKYPDKPWDFSMT